MLFISDYRLNEKWKTKNECSYSIFNFSDKQRSLLLLLVTQFAVAVANQYLKSRCL